MTRSIYFWTGIVLLAIIPLLLIDVAEHSVNWKKEVREEMISAVHDQYAATTQEKAVVLDRILERNQVLNFLIYAKVFACIFLLTGGIYLVKRYRKKEAVWKTVAIQLLVIAGFISIKIFLAVIVLGNANIHILSEEQKVYSLEALYKKYYVKGKVLYVDFWGTTCGPCLKEFRDYTHPLKKRYAGNSNIAYLYIAQGNNYIWKQQLKKYDLEGDHIFTDAKTYDELYRSATKDSNVEMPRYIILDKHGAVVVSNAKRPSDKDSLYAELDKYLLQ